jgi:hypothetical protein
MSMVIDLPWWRMIDEWWDVDKMKFDVKVPQHSYVRLV